jgi:hypothetical protein
MCIDYKLIYVYCKYKRDILRRYKIIFCVTLDYTTTFVLPIVILTYYIGSLSNTDDKSPVCHDTIYIDEVIAG